MPKLVEALSKYAAIVAASNPLQRPTTADQTMLEQARTIVEGLVSQVAHTLGDLQLDVSYIDGGRDLAINGSVISPVVRLTYTNPNDAGLRADKARSSMILIGVSGTLLFFFSTNDVSKRADGAVALTSHSNVHIEDARQTPGLVEDALAAAALAAASE